MNRRFFLKASASLLGLFSLSRLDKLEADETFESKLGLGKYINHKVTGDVYSYENGRLPYTFCDEVPDQVSIDDDAARKRDRKTGIWYISFPVENLVYLEFEKGTEVYRKFNVPKAEVASKSSRDLYEHVWYDCYWKLSHIVGRDSLLVAVDEVKLNEKMSQKYLYTKANM